MQCVNAVWVRCRARFCSYGDWSRYNCFTYAEVNEGDCLPVVAGTYTVFSSCSFVPGTLLPHAPEFLRACPPPRQRLSVSAWHWLQSLHRAQIRHRSYSECGSAIASLARRLAMGRAPGTWRHRERNMGWAPPGQASASYAPPLLMFFTRASRQD